MTPEEKKQRDREYSRKYYYEHQEERIAYARNRRKTYPEEYRAKYKAYYAAHRDARIEYARKYHAGRRELDRESCRLYRAAHRDELNRKKREHYARKKQEKLLAMQEEKLRKEAGYFKLKKESPVVNGKVFRLDTCPVCGSREVGRIGNKSYFCRSCFREITQHKIYYYDKEGIRRLES